MRLFFDAGLGQVLLDGYGKSTTQNQKGVEMNSKILRILAIGLTTMFFSGQAFACPGAKTDKDVGNTGDRNQYSMSDSSNSDQALPSDQNLNKDQDINNNQDLNKDQDINKDQDVNKDQDMDQSQSDQSTDPSVNVIY
jgi:hypothetical protein